MTNPTLTTPIQPKTNLPVVRPSYSVLKTAYDESHAKMWLSPSVRDILIYGKKNIPDIQYAGILASYRQGIVNLIYNLTGKVLPVQFSSGNDNYSTGDKIVLSFTSDPREIDQQIGLAMHEAWHCIASKRTSYEDSIPLFSWMQYITPANLYEYVKIKNPELYSNLEKYVESVLNNTKSNSPGPSLKIQMMVDVLYKYFRIYVNILEDRRIDTLGFRASPGYHPYYEALYKKFFHNEEISNALNSPVSKLPTLDMYLLHICDITNKDANPNALPGLRDIWKIINLKNITRFGNSDKKWKTISKISSTNFSTFPLPDMLEASISILNNIFKHVKYIPFNEMPQEVQDKLKGDMRNSQKPKEGAEDLPNLDMSNMIEMSAEEFLDMMEQLESRINGTEKKEIIGNSDLIVKINAIQSGDTKIKETDAVPVGHRIEGTLISPVPVVVHYGLRSQYKTTENFNFLKNVINSGMQTSMEVGIRMGNFLAHKIRIFTDENNIKYTNQKNGALDPRRIAAGGYGASDIFMRKFSETHGKIHLHMSIDSSGSMQGTKFEKSMAVGIALAQVAYKLREKFHFVLSLRSGGILPEIAIIFDSKKHSMSYLRDNFSYLSTWGGTPEGLCFASILDEIIEINDPTITQKYFINISDGCPEFNYNGVHYGGTLAAKHTAGVINKMRQAGVNVLSYFISYGEGYEHVQNDFRAAYGKSASFINIDNINDVLRTLNKMLMQNII